MQTMGNSNEKFNFFLFLILIAFIKILVNKCFRFDFANKIVADRSYCNCIEWNPSLNYSAVYYFAYLFWNFIQAYLFPILIMLVLYSRLISILRQRADRTRSNLLHEVSLNNARSLHMYEIASKNASKVNMPLNYYYYLYTKLKFNWIKKTKNMLILIISIFVLNWLPIHLFHFYSFYLNVNGSLSENNDNYFQENKTFNKIYYICQWMSMSSTFINPICYSFMHKHFRVFFVFI